MSATQKAEQVPEAGGERRRLSGAASELADAFKATVRGVIRLRGRDTRLGGAELSYAQLELLSELLARGQAPAGELATAARLSPGAVTEMLDHLAQAGHVERLRSQSDRRVVLSRLTPDGRALLIAKRDAWEERWRYALDGVSERDLRAATQVLIRLRSLFDDAPECDSQSR